MKYVLEHISGNREMITVQLMEEIRELQNETVEENTDALQEQLSKLSEKKQNAVDLMLEGIITKDDLKKQVARYDKEIAEVTERISMSKNADEYYSQQLESIRNFIEQINSAAQMEKAVTYEDRVLEMYLTCVPFGFRLTYHKHRGLLAKDTFCNVIIEKCEII